MKIELENIIFEFDCDVDNHGYGVPKYETPSSISEAFMHRATSYCKNRLISTGVVYMNHIKMDMISMLPLDISEMSETIKFIKQHESYEVISKIWRSRMGQELLDFGLKLPIKL